MGNRRCRSYAPLKKDKKGSFFYKQSRGDAPEKYEKSVVLTPSIEKLFQNSTKEHSSDPIYSSCPSIWVR